MNEDQRQRSRIDRILVGDPISAGERTLRPVARASGWAGAGGDEQGRGAGALLRVRPLEVRVIDPGGEEYIVSVTDPTGDAVRRIAVMALVVAAVSALLLLVGLLRPRR
jgi:uncharacterized spore protein YtfJ